MEKLYTEFVTLTGTTTGDITADPTAGFGICHTEPLDNNNTLVELYYQLGNHEDDPDLTPAHFHGIAVTAILRDGSIEAE